MVVGLMVAGDPPHGRRLPFPSASTVRCDRGGYRAAMRQHACSPNGATRMLTHGGSVAVGCPFGVFGRIAETAGHMISESIRPRTELQFHLLFELSLNPAMLLTV